MNGLGFLIWQLANMPSPEELARLLKDIGARWVSIKVLDGPYLFNAKNGNQKLLKAYWAALEDVNIDVGAWQYVYGEQPGLEGDAAAAFYEEFQPCHWLVDAEGHYKRYGASKAAKIYCDKLHNGRLDVYLCSYRFPSMHGGLTKPFPFSAFMSHARVDGAAPQIYWALSHDPVSQLERCFQEYSKLSSKCFLPIGPTFGETFTVGANKVYWEPTTPELEDFINICHYYKFSAYGFYSLDYILKHNRQDWLTAITGKQLLPPPPPPPEPTLEQRVSVLEFAARSHGWEI